MIPKFEIRGEMEGNLFQGFIKIDKRDGALFLTPHEINVLQVALTHMEEHLEEVIQDHHNFGCGGLADYWQNRKAEAIELLRYLTPAENG